MPTVPPAHLIWQTGKSLPECSLYMYENEIVCDVTFLVGGNKVQAHAFILISRSPVFQAMLCGPMAETQKTIPLPDVELESFRLLLRYMYSDQVAIDETNVMGTLYISRKYDVHGLIKICTDYLSENIRSDTACTIMCSVDIYDMPDLYQKCFAYILENAEKCLLSTAFREMSGDCIKVVLEADKLMVDELTIWRALVKWAETKCVKQGKDVNDRNIRAAMGDLVYLIRFRNMNPGTFAKNITVSKILTQDEVADIFRFYHHAIDAVDKFSMKNGRHAVNEVLTNLRCIRFPCNVELNLFSMPAQQPSFGRSDYTERLMFPGERFFDEQVSDKFSEQWDNPGNLDFFDTLEEDFQEDRYNHNECYDYNFGYTSTELNKNSIRSFSGKWNYSGSPDCISFSVTDSVVLCGIILYSSRVSDSKYTVAISLTDDHNTTLLSENVIVDTNPSQNKFDVMFNEVELTNDCLYDLCVTIRGSCSYWGEDGNSTVTTGGVTVEFQSSSKSTNGTNVSHGQIPGLILHCLKPVV